MNTDEDLTDFIKEHDEIIIEKGFALFRDNMEGIIIESRNRKKYLVKVPDDREKMGYLVSLKVLAYGIEDNCKCNAHAKSGDCKHTIAAALFLLMDEFHYDTDELKELIDIDYVDEEPAFPETNRSIVEEQYNNETVKVIKTDKTQNAEWKKFEIAGSMNQNLLHNLSGYFWPSHTDFYKVKQISFDEKERWWIFGYKHTTKQAYTPEIKYDGYETYHYRCNCNNKSNYPMCRHVRVIFDMLINDEGTNYFLQFKDRRVEKNNLLKLYGLTIEDEDAKLFQFSVSYAGELLMQAPGAYIRAGDTVQLKKFHQLLKPLNSAAASITSRPRPVRGTLIDFETGFVFNLTSQRLRLGYELEPVKVYRKHEKADLKKLSLNQAANLSLLNDLGNDEYNLLLQLSDTGLLDYLQEQGHNYFRNRSNPWQYISDSAIEILEKHYINSLQKLWPYLSQHPNVFLLADGKFSTTNCKPVHVSLDMVEPSFHITADDRFITISLIPIINGNAVFASPVIRMKGFIFNVNDTLHIIKNSEDLAVFKQFNNGFIKIPVTEKLEVLQNIIMPLQERFNVQLPEGFEIKTIQVAPEPNVLLKEFNNQFMMLQPQFVYDTIEVEYTLRPEDIVNTLPDGSLEIIKRDVPGEKQFVEMLRSLHPVFNNQRQNDFFYVHFNEVMKGNWFLNTVRFLQENNVTVKGMQELRRFRYNTFRPKWEMKTGSGVDWFDLRITVSFGDQQVPFRDIRKAILSRQNIVVLGDGTFGVLPEEWLRQYGMLLKMGDEQKDGLLRISKLHFTLIDELYSEIDDEEILKEIQAKKQKLLDIDNILTVQQSKHVHAILRPYQLSGFHWLQTLDELGWGGCLADDMGLGKTLQSITFLQYLKEKYAGSSHLVVCPTSLIYNWENELKKFAPQLRYHIYYGSGREFTNEHFENYDIIITSYALVRIDMEQLLRFEWHYVILDESQAIKNPDAQTTKAVQLLKSKNRLILSGTPVQNNTFDLYAQFNFINPGLLGNKEFYKNEFANAIDKYNDAEKSSQLRKLIYPFLLRRTKEQVAKDLPDKTEIILWCQLLKEQRSVYEDYKNYYRNLLMQKIEEEGMAKAGIYVLEGLLRLRQVCDSPQLLKDAEITTTQSIKTEELVREIEENTGEHKLLVFSQFTEMLHLIQQALQQKNIAYCYLDGSTPAKKRRDQVHLFQTSENIKVFLISLKAGGLGLNLTAADYVYIVDPWWNPASEQQAIDRTHRIGQTRKIFAYKMICKDTVEEKILELQKRKKQLANELVTEDAGFIKKLNKDDVAFLFS